MMLNQRLIPLEAAQEWALCLRGLPHAYAHSLQYNHAMKQTSHYPTYLYVATAANFKVVCPIAVREKLGYPDIFTPYGFGGFISQGSCPDFAQHFHDFMKSQDFVCGYLALNPLFTDHDLFRPEEVSAGNTIYCLDLMRPLDEIFASFAKSHRYELRAWLNSQPNVTTNTNEILAVLPGLYRDTLTRVQAKSVYQFTDETIRALVTNDAALTIGVKENDEIIAVAVFLCSQYVADYFLNASTVGGRVHTRGLIWKAIEILKLRNIPRLNIGGGVKNNDHLDDFKRRFNGQVLTPYVVKQIYQPAHYTTICQQVVTQKAKNYFPIYHF